MPHISSFNLGDVREVMKHAPRVRSWNGLLKYMMDNDAYKGRHEGNALPGLIQAVNQMRERDEAFTNDPAELWERINTRPSDIGDEGGHARLRGRELEDGYVNTNRASEPFPRKEPDQFGEAAWEGGRPAVPFAGEMGEGLPEQRENTVPIERPSGASMITSRIKSLARRASESRPAAKGLFAAGIAGLALAGVLRRRAARSKSHRHA